MSEFCIDCGKEKNDSRALRCHKCANIHWHKNKGHSKKIFCVDCKKVVSYGPRCHSCENKRRHNLGLNENFYCNVKTHNPNWKGGISFIPFEKKYGMIPEEWQKLSQSIRKRDKFICQYCGKKNSTSVHHIFPKRIRLDNHPDNLITLCRSCHVKIERLTDKYLKEDRDPMEIFYEKWSI